MTNRPVSMVSEAALESLLEEVRLRSAGSADGVLGPDSISWAVNRESALFLAAGRAALLQLAHPWVAAAIAEHSTTLSDPIGRFHRTFRIMFTISFGSFELASAAALRLHRLHSGIKGNLPDAAGQPGEGSRYEANEVSALLWVYATLIDSTILAYDLILPPLNPTEREQYYAECCTSAAFFGLGPNVLPRNWEQFGEYMESMYNSDVLVVNPIARSLAQQVLSGGGAWLRIPEWYRALTAFLLPRRFREEFDFAYGEKEERSAERALRWVRRIYRHLPKSVRYVGPCLEAEERLAGRSHPSLSVRLSNRLWIGEPSLFFPR